MSSAAAFLEACAAREPGSFVSTAELHAAYEAWCQERGEQPLCIVAFGQELFRLGLNTGLEMVEVVDKTAAGKPRKKPFTRRWTKDLRAWQGLRLAATT